MDTSLEEKKYIKRKDKAIAEGNRVQQAINCNRLGDLYNERGQYQNALKEYEEEAKIYEKLEKPLEMARAHRMAGEMQMMLGVFDEAKIHTMKYLETVSSLNNTVEEQRAYTTLGRLHLLHGQSLNDTSLTQALTQLRGAEKAFLKSLLLTKKLSGLVSKMELLDMQARCYLNIGIVKEHMEEFNESITYIEKAIKISKAHDIYELTHQCYISLSLMYHCKKNDACSALRLCNQALEVAKRLPQKVKRICETLIIKAEILIKEGEFSSAKQILSKAYKKNTPNENDRNNIIRLLKTVIKLCRLLDNLVTISSTDYTECKRLYEQLGDGCCRLGNYKKALEYYHQMYECAKKNQESGKSLSPIYVSLYQTYKDDKQYERALEFLWKEYEVRKDEASEACSTLLSIAEICELQQQTFWSIQDVYRQALEHASKVEVLNTHVSLEKITYLRLRKLQQKHGMNALAEELTKEANEKGINLDSTTDDSDSDCEFSSNESEKLPTFDDDDIHLSMLSESDVSDSDEREKLPSIRTKRGTRPFVIKRNNKGETQLHQACISGNIELVCHLVDQGHALNVRDHAGWLPLHEACNHGYREIVEYLLDHGALSSINDKGGTSCDGITPLYDASSNGYLDVVELLLDRGADVTLKTDFGESCVDALDKWRRASTLTDGEQMHYKALRERMLKNLSVVTGKKSPQTSKTVSLYDDDNDSSGDDTVGEVDVQGDTFPTTTYPENRPNKQDRRNSFNKNSVNEMRVTQSKDTRALSDEDAYDDIEYMKPNKKKHCRQTKLRLHLLDSSKSFSSSAKPQRDSLTPKNNELQMFMDTVVNPKKKSNFMKSHAFSNRLRVEHASVERSNYKKENETPEELISSTVPDSTTTFIQQPPVQIVAPPVIPSVVSFKVKVEDEFFLVPIEHTKLNDTTMRWLADEVTKRYYDTVGLKPLLRLKTADGFAYADTDCVNVALQHNVIIGSVIEWQTAPLGQRFEEICGGLQLRNHSEIKSELEKGEFSNIIRLRGFWLNPVQCQAIFKCLMHQKNIRILDLSNNFMQNEGCTHLAKCLPTLTHLGTLNLRGNYIEQDGLEELLTSLSNSTKQISIEELILSHNPLGNAAIRLIDKFCNSPAGQNLKKLHLSNCSITQLNDGFKCLVQLVDFDISFNSLTYDTFMKVLKHLNANLLQNINISYCQNVSAASLIETNGVMNENENNSIGDIIMEFFESGTCCKMQNVHLINCQLSDIHVYKILQRLAKSDDLTLLDISHNERLYSTTLFLIFHQLPQLRKLIALKCKDFLQLDDDITRLAHLKGIPQFIMISKFSYVHHNSISETLDFKNIFYMYWKDKAKMKNFNNFVVFYVNDSDLDEYL